MRDNEKTKTLSIVKGAVHAELCGFYIPNVTEEILTVIGTILGSQQFVQPGKKRRSEHMQLCTALENWRQDEIKKGYSQGISEGFSQGISQGISQRNLALATKWFADGRSTAEIALLLGLPETEIREMLM